MSKDMLGSFNDPKMLALLKEINRIKDEIANTPDDEKKAALKKILSEKQMHYNILSERRAAP